MKKVEIIVHYGVIPPYTPQVTGRRVEAIQQTAELVTAAGGEGGRKGEIRRSKNHPGSSRKTVMYIYIWHMYMYDMCFPMVGDKLIKLANGGLHIHYN